MQGLPGRACHSWRTTHALPRINVDDGRLVLLLKGMDGEGEDTLYL
jgi:hypothetical protein